MNQNNWMRYGCYEGVREDSNTLEILFGQKMGGKANNFAVRLALLLWWVMKCGTD